MRGRCPKTVFVILTILGILIKAFTGTAAPASIQNLNAAAQAYINRDYTTAANIWQTLAKREDRTAQFNLGYLYQWGKGLPRDYDLALKWYRLAAAKGSFQAQYAIGEMYENGMGLPKDQVQAYVCYSRAAANGLPGGNVLLKRFAERMTPKQLAEARHLVR